MAETTRGRCRGPAPRPGASARVPDVGWHHDVPYDVAWGRQTNAVGFTHYYYGNYFPLQYHVFQFAAWSSHALSIGGPTALKAVDLLSDAGIGAVLLLVANRLRLGLLLPIGYWLAPYTVAMDWLGYVDFQMGFFAALAALVLSGGRTPTRLIVASFSLGAAALMKPQALTLVGVLAALLVLGLLCSRRRRAVVRDALLLAVGPLSLFILYSTWLAAAGRGAGYLARTMLDFGRFQGPALTANMTNVWMVLAQAYRKGNQPVYDVTGPHYSVVQTIAAAATAATVLVGVVLVARRIDVLPLHLSVIAVFAFGAMALPSTMTRAHENHFFLGAIFGLAAAAAFRSALCSVAVHVSLMLQFVALFALYGFGTDGPHWTVVKDWQSSFLRHQEILWSVAGVISFAAYCIAMIALMQAIRGWPAVTSESSQATASPLLHTA